MIDLSDCIELGTITKTHGVHGQVILRLNNLQFEDIIKMEQVFIEIDGLPVPFFIIETSQKSREAVILSIEDIITGEKATELIDSKVFIQKNSLNKTVDPSLHSKMLLGYEVVDINHGRLGVLDDIIDFQMNPLFRILNDKKEILLPVHHEFVLEIDDKKKKIIVSTPPGLTDLFQ